MNRLPRAPFVSLLLLTLACAIAPYLSAAEKLQVCGDQPALGQPEWVRNAVIYEINVRQYSDTGKFAAVTADLPRIKDLGVDILWLMPVHPIGEKNRKGPLGSYYAVRDYLAINPEFGTETDFRAFVDAAHGLGLRVILDWVGNHTAWDNPLTTQHPEFYLRDAKGDFQPPTGFDWTDVIQLDFTNPAVLEYQVGAMSHWVKNFGVDGFRCDFATGVPTAFWDKLSSRLRALRDDLYLLSESEVPQHQLRAFHSSYAFTMMKTINAVAEGEAGVSHIDDTLARTQVLFPAGASMLYYTSNHDENSWAGTEFERLRGGVETFAVLSFVLDGVPLIYNGQEIGLDRRLKFFERDPIAWNPHRLTVFYRTLCELKGEHPALRTGAKMRRLATTQNESLYAVLREASGHRVLALLNLTARAVDAELYDKSLAGEWRDAFTGEKKAFQSVASVKLGAWQYRVLTSTP